MTFYVHECEDQREDRFFVYEATKLEGEWERRKSRDRRKSRKR